QHRCAVDGDLVVPLPMRHVFGTGYPSLPVGIAIFGVACLVTGVHGFQMARTTDDPWVVDSAAAGTFALWSWSWMMILVPSVILGLLDGDLGAPLAYLFFGSGISLVLALVGFWILLISLFIGKLLWM